MPRDDASAEDRSHSIIAKDGMLYYDITGNNVMLYAGTRWVTQGFFPVGAIAMWRGTDIPPGWALCDGSSSGIPDLRGKFVVGYDPADTDYSPIGKTGGANSVVLDATHLPSHSHSVNDPGHTHSASASHGHRFSVEQSASRNSKKNGVSGGGSPSFQQTITTETVSFSGTISTGNATIGSTEVGYTGGGGTHENRPPYYVLAFIIKIN